MLRVLHSLLPERLKTVLKKNRAVKNLYYSAKPFMRSRYDFFTIQDLTTLTLQWVKTFPEQYDVIIGIPRSGMIVASIIACKLGKPLTTPDLMLQNKCWLPKRRKIVEMENVRNALLVDDSVGGGQTMQTYYHLLKDAFGNRVNIIKASLFVEKRSKNKVDLYYKLLTKNYFFEWNLAHATYGERLGVDMDGVLCDEPPVEVDMDEQRYVAWIKNARPNIIPTYTIEAIVTNRLEKYRQITEEWLRRNKVKYKHLEMLNLPDKSLRTPENMLKQKIDAIKKYELSWFWESSLSQAEAIWKACRIPVLCTDKMVLLS